VQETKNEMNLLRSLFGRMAAALRGRYVLLLEEEIARLRAENRAMMNSLLGTAGLPPVEWPAPPAKVREIPRLRRRSWPQIQAQRAADAVGHSSAASTTAHKGV
jgi:hypothetical protein